MEYKFKIKTIEQIKEEILKENNQKIEFIEDIKISLPELYKEIIIKYENIHISSSCEIYSYNTALDITKKSNLDIEEKSIKYWFFGEDYSEGYWVINKNGKISYKDCERFSDGKIYNIKNIIDLNINFEQWLQFAYLDFENEKALEKIFDSGFDEIILEAMEKETINEYLNLLKELSIELYEFRKGTYIG